MNCTYLKLIQRKHLLIFNRKKNHIRQKILLLIIYCAKCMAHYILVEINCWKRSHREVWHQFNYHAFPSRWQRISMHKTTKQPNNTPSICSTSRRHSPYVWYTEDRGHVRPWHLLPIYVHTRKRNLTQTIARIPPRRVWLISCIRDTAPCQALIKKILFLKSFNIQTPVYCGCLPQPDFKQHAFSMLIN